jgi:septum formation topological specificity factor MinE
MSARENIAINLQKQLENMTDPAVGSVSRVFFDVQKLAITQFPAILIITGDESREDITTDERLGIITYNLRCYVRGNQIDTLRNEIVERIEETLEVSRDRDITLSADNIHSVTTRVIAIEVVERELPLGEVVVTVEVRYRYKKGVV